MVFGTRKHSITWMEHRLQITQISDNSKDTHFRLKIKWRLELFDTLGIMGRPFMRVY